MYQMRGLGVVMKPEGGYRVPGWCSWLPFSSFNDACAPPTPDQVLSESMSNLGGHANPALIPILQRQWAEADAQQCAENPEACADYLYAVEHPALSATIGPSAGVAASRAIAAVSDAVENAADGVKSALSINWGMVALVGSAAVLALVAIGGGTPRRYGR